MATATDNHVSDRMRTYRRAESAVFLKTKERYGGLSNMAGGFPLVVNDIPIRSSEALYQACRFPHIPDVQRLIIEQKSPMTAKMKGKPHRNNSRPDWDSVRVKIMRWCLQVKLAQNWDKFSELLLETGDMPIVEHSRRDDFWGAKPVDDHVLVGINVLGRLLMELRERVKLEPRELLLRVEPLSSPDFLLYERQIEPIGTYNTQHGTEQLHLAEHQPCYVYSLESVLVPEQGTFPDILAKWVDKNGPIANGSLPVNINTAPASEFMGLSGIGDKRAADIVIYREANGPFNTPEDIVGVRGIGKGLYTRIAGKITVGQWQPSDPSEPNPACAIIAATDFPCPEATTP